MSRHALLALLLLLAISGTAAPQSKETANSATKNTADKNKAAKELEAEILRERRANAQSLLISLAADAVKFNDQALRARTQARIADALWDGDTDRARTLFRNAWEAAEIADQEGQERFQEEIRQTRARTGGGYAVASPREVRREVLRLAAKRDRALGEEFLARFKTQKEQEATEAKNRSNPFGSSDDSIRQRLDLARQLLEAGDIERALQFADPVLGTVGMPAIDFLSYLREKDPKAADLRYAAMLADTAASPLSDANSVSLLSSYLFTPHLFISFSSGGTYTTSSGRAEPPIVTAELRTSFFRTAASILLRPLAPPGPSSGYDGQYLVIKRLLPLFEQYAPQEMTTALRAQLEALSSLASKSTRERDDDDLVRKGIRPDRFEENWEQWLLDRIDRAKTSEERDRLNFELASLLASKGDLRARDYVAKIDDTEMRNNAREYIDASMAMRAVDKKDVERAQEIARTGELTHLQRAWLLTQTAKLLVKSDRDKALGLIEEAAAEARRIDGSDPDGPRAFFAVTNALLLVNRQTAWDVIGDAVKAANSAESFTGEDGELTLRFATKGMSSVHQSSVPDFDVTGIFDALAREDYEKAVDLARGFQRDAPRATAVLAIARSVLEEKKK